MDAFWSFPGWCLLMFLVFGLFALGCMLLRLRGGCGCGVSMHCAGRQPPLPPAGPSP